MRKNFLMGHVADSVLGRVGITIDWPKSLPDYDFPGWGNYMFRPAVGWDWQNVLLEGSSLIARNAVKPFALFYYESCNLIMISEDLFQSVPDWSDTLNDIVTGEISFGKRTRPFRFASLTFGDTWTTPPLSPRSQFDVFDRSRHHMHGTHVMRGEETTDQLPAPVMSDLSFASFDEFREARRSNTMSRQNLLPSYLELRTKRMPLLFCFGIDLFARDDLTALILDQKTPGIGFPFPPLSVDFAG